jgi:hypothetical protein
MAKINRPPRKRTKGAPPPEFEASTNLSRNPDQELRPLNFKVAASFKREFKSYATEMDTSMVDLLQQCFYYFKTNR